MSATLMQKPLTVSAVALILVLGGVSCSHGLSPERVGNPPNQIGTSKSASADSDARFEYQEAVRYAKGEGVPKDYVKAAECMRRSADQGYALAQCDLGAFYARGLGVKQDYEEAARWYRKAADQGEPFAEYSLGFIHSIGRGVPVDLQEALKWFKRAAEQNQPDALLALGDAYMNGRDGILIDQKEALKWFQKAVDHGRFEALDSIGFIYEYGGGGVEQNPGRACECYREAAMKGDARGQMNLGRMYLEGTGVKKNLVEAYTWFDCAYKNGEGVAKHYLEELRGESPLSGNSLTAEELKQARAQTSESSNPNDLKEDSRN